MARDPSPFAQRLKALTGRGGRPADADVPAGTDTGVVPAAAAGAPQEPADGAQTPPDEQPTGEFPAVAAPNGPAAAEPETVHEQPAPVDAIHTTDTFSADPGPDAADAVTPAPDPIEPGPAESVSSWPVPPPVKPGMTPWLEPEEAAASHPDAPTSQFRPAPPIWLDPPSHEQAPPQAAAPSDPTFAPALPTPDDAYDAPADDPGGIAPPDGPTLAPPNLSARQVDESAESEGWDEPSTWSEAPESGPEDLSAQPHTLGEPSSTPQALNDALALPSERESAELDGLDSGEDESSAGTPEPGLPASVSDEIAIDDTAPSGEVAEDDLARTDTAPVEGPVAPAAGARRGRFARPSFGRRGARPEADEVTEPNSDDRVATDTSLSTPAVADAPSIAATVAVPGDAQVVEAGDTDLHAQGPAGADPSADLTVVDAPDPGSVTSRFSAIGRRAKALTVRKTEDATDAESSDSPDTSAPAPNTEPVPERTGPIVDDAPELPKPSFAERSALRRRVKSLRARRDAGLVELGAIVVDQSRFGDPTGGALVRRRTRDLADLDHEIASIEDVLDQDRSAEAVAQLGIVHCVDCSALVGPADGFCAQCGAPRPFAGEADVPATRQ